MGTLYLVRHGQASFGTDDYDRLSDLGRRQCERLGAWFRARGVVFEAALVGTLRRQLESLAAIDLGLGRTPPVEPLSWPGLNEYDSHAVIRAIHPQPLERPRDAAQVRQHFRLLRDGLAEWMAARARPEGMPSYAEFAAGVAGALAHVRAHHGNGDVLLVSSGGPISTAVGQVLGMSPEATIELNLRIRNSALTEFVVTPRRCQLLTYNTLPHLEGVDPAAWVTYT
jgi:broad specificity phosphatase PhoE